MLVPFLDRLTVEELDTVPYGIVQVDPSGIVRTFNKAEADSCGFSARPLGQHYFTDVHPGAAVPAFHERFIRALATQSFDETFPFTFVCLRRTRELQVRLYYSLRTDSVWIFTAQPDGSALVRMADGAVLDAPHAA